MSPRDYTDAELVEGYIMANGVTGDDSCWWANEELMSLVWEDPERAWPIMVAVVERDPPMWVLAILAAGPLEDLLRAHGSRFIERVEQEAIRNKRFRDDVLVHVYPHVCDSQEVADRIAEVTRPRRRPHDKGW